MGPGNGASESPFPHSVHTPHTANIMTLLLLLPCLLLIPNLSQAQNHMPSTYLPKEYFLSDGRRDPRHGGDLLEAQGSSTTTTTYHLNPQAPGNSLGLGTTSPNTAIHAMNNQFGIRLVPHQQLQELQREEGQQRTRRRSQGSQTRHRRRLPKSLLRPPKEYIIYSLPEQSFWAPEVSTAEERSANTGGEQQRGSSETAEEEEGAPRGNNGGHLRGGGVEEEVQEVEGQLRGGGGEDQMEETPPQEHQGGEEIKQNVVDLSEAPNPSLAERKVLLGQCMKSCIDALL